MLRLIREEQQIEMNSVRQRRGRPFTATLVIAVLLTGVFATDADAAKRRRHSSRRPSATTQAQKNQAIKSIQQQVAAAQGVLSAAQSQTTMSQSQVSEAMSKLKKIRSDIEVAHDDVQQASKSLREIEAEIVAEQTPESEYGKAKTAFDDAQHASHLIIHRLAGLPGTIDANESRSGLDHLSGLTAEQQKELEADTAYQTAERQLQLAASTLKELRQKLFESDSDWTAGQRELLDAKQRSSEETRQVKSVGLESLRDQQQLNHAQQVAMEARRVIAQGEVRLRQLGAKQLPSKSSTSSKQRPAK